MVHPVVSEGHHSPDEHALDGHALGGLQMEHPDIEEEQAVLDSTLGSQEEEEDLEDHEISLFEELKGLW